MGGGRLAGLRAVMSVRAVAAGGAGYYAKDDYYFGRGGPDSTEGAPGGFGGEATTPLTWGGRGAERLGLGGRATMQDFQAVMDGRNPDPAGPPFSVKDRRSRDGSETERDGQTSSRSEHRPGLDLTFSAPKSVSIAALVGGNERLVEAHAAAIGRVMTYIEDHYALTRRRDGQGGIERVATGNLLYAQTTHATSRAGDPNLHTHVIVANAVFDQDAGEWRALNNREIYANQVMLGLVYQRELAGSLMRQGYDVRSANLDGRSHGREGMFEIADCPQPVLEAFSKRHAQIMANAAVLKPQTPAQFEIAVLKDRPSKIETPAHELMGVWEEQAAYHGFDARDWTAAKSDASPGRDVTSTRLGVVRLLDQFASQVRGAVHGLIEPLGAVFEGRRGDVEARAVLTEAVQVSEAKSAVFSRGDLLRTAMKAAPAQVSFGALERAWELRLGDGELRPADLFLHEGVTTERALATEAAIVGAVRQGVGRSTPLYGREAGLQRSVQGLMRPDASVRLGEDQVRAAALILSSPDRFVAVQGVAGAGKSTMFAVVGEAAREIGVTIVGMAPTLSAKESLAEKAGFEVMTVQHFLAANAELAEGRASATSDQLEAWQGKVIVLDEASMVDNADKLKLIHLVEALDIRKLALVGDRGQLPAITAGAPFSLLLDTAIGHATMDTVRRQRDPQLREAVEALAQGRSVGLRDLGGRVVEAGEGVGALGLAAIAFEEWRSAHDRGVDRPIIAVSQEQRSAVNGIILQHLEEAGEVAKIGSERDILTQHHLTGPERWRASNYRLDQVLVFHSRLEAAAIGKGEHAQIVGLDRSRSGNLLTVRREDGQLATIGLNALRRRGEDKFVPYDLDRGGQLYSGATYVFERTETSPEIDVRAGQAFKVIGESDGRIELRLSDGRALSLAGDDKQLLFIGPGYAMTTHRSQGLTMAEDPIGILSSRNATLAGAYVQVSRAVSGITIVTDSFANLVRNIGLRDGLNPIATFSVRAGPGLDRDRATAQSGPFDPSLRKAEPDKSILQDRPPPSDPSL